MSEVEFDKSIGEFMNRLQRIETEKLQVKLIPNLQEDWLKRIRNDLNNKSRATQVAEDSKN